MHVGTLKSKTECNSYSCFSQKYRSEGGRRAWNIVAWVYSAHPMNQSLTLVEWRENIFAGDSPIIASPFPPYEQSEWLQPYAYESVHLSSNGYKQSLFPISSNSGMNLDYKIFWLSLYLGQSVWKKIKPKRNIITISGLSLWALSL